MKTIHVVAAVIQNGELTFATERGYGPWKDYWEFPGGKIEPGETPEEALRREIREELNTEISVGEKLTTVEYDYPEFHLIMDCYAASVVHGSLELMEHEAAKWLRKDELDSVRWLPADLEVIELLKGKETAPAMIFDTHAHYDDPAFDEDRDEVIRALPESGVGLVLIPGCNLETSYQAVALADRYPHVYAAIGCHPQDAHTFAPSDIDEYRKLAAHPKVVAVGEIGLDYYWEQNPPKEVQQDVFRQQMALAEELALPVLIHNRDAHQDSLAIVQEFPKVGGVFHCFSGSPEYAKILLKLGWYLGFDGPITFKNAKKNVETVRIAPLDRIVIETDSPYMSPEPLRGRRNDSRNLKYIVEKLAEIKDVPVEEAIRVTTENGKRLFGITDGMKEKA